MIIQITPIASTAHFDGLSTPIRYQEYAPAMSARFAITMMSAASTPHPAIQPIHGPIARVHHENVVPQSGSALFR